MAEHTILHRLPKPLFSFGFVVIWQQEQRKICIIISWKSERDRVGEMGTISGLYTDGV